MGKRALTIVFVDGVEQGVNTLGYIEDTGNGMISRTFVQPLSPGPHTIEVERRTEGGHTAVFERGTLTVFCVPLDGS